MSRFWIVLVLLVCIGMNLTMPDWHEASLVSHGQVRGQSDILLDALGELRTWMAKSVWLEVDVYHHAMESQGIYFKDEEGLMPLLKLVIILDPTFEEAYATAGYHLVFNFHHYAEGLALLDQGLQRCPRSWPIRWERAFAYYHVKSFARAADAAEAAYVVAPTDIDRINALRLAMHACVSVHQIDRALETGQRMLTIWPGDRTVLLDMQQIRQLKAAQGQ